MRLIEKANCDWQQETPIENIPKLCWWQEMFLEKIFKLD